MADRLRVAIVLALLVALVGCGGGESEPATSPDEAATTTATACGDEEAEAVTLTTEGGTELDAALLGEGTVGVVLGHQYRSDMCAWVPFAKRLAERGMRALAINFGSASIHEDMVAGAQELERRGAEEIFLVGASMGGTAALVAAEAMDVAGVAALSAPQEFSGIDALPAVRELEAPTLLLVDRQDGAFAGDARRLYQATSSPEKSLVMTDGSGHGTELLEDPEAERALLDFLVGEPR